jgi:predicted DNA-binding ribbon-helix-helix protein
MPARTKTAPHPPREEAPQLADYGQDFFGWLLEQSALLKAGRLDDLDRDNLIAELDGLARSEFDKLVSFLRLVLLHMLKWEHQAERRSRSWTISIALHRDHAEELLADNPSFGPKRNDALARAYRRARLEAADETGLLLQTFPDVCPYQLVDVLTRPYPID